MKKILVLVSISELCNFHKIWREVVIWFYWCDENLLCLDSQKAWNLNRNLIQVNMSMKRLAQKVTYCEVCELQNTFFGHEDVWDWNTWCQTLKMKSDQEVYVLMFCWRWVWMLLLSVESTCCDIVSRIFWNISTWLPDYIDSHLRGQYTSNYRTVYFCKT